jgi:ligand-binding SRPBCC domain-containing protein
LEIIISTIVEQNFRKVWHGFDANLLSKLSPPFPRVRILSFGNQINDKIIIELIFFIVRQKWISIITEKKIFDDHAFFVDEGEVLPFFLKSWKHTHIVEKIEENTLIIDKIEFRTPSILTDYIFYPLLYLQFIYRKPIYKKIFRKNET